jgi:hypothetical protein
MATLALVSEREATGKVKEIYEQIQQAFGLSFVPNLFKAMAHNPDLLEANWRRLGTIMGRGHLDRKTAAHTLPTGALTTAELQQPILALLPLGGWFTGIAQRLLHSLGILA